MPKKYAALFFEAGGGQISNYSECSFNTEGAGTFKAGEGSNPFVGDIGKRHTENEIRIEVIFPAWAEKAIYQSMIAAHPYEEVAYDIISLSNTTTSIGSGLVGELPEKTTEAAFLYLIKEKFKLSLIKHTPLNR
ncbi:MAG: hypothetical protein WDM90_04315 [Ferruginibacter sp.]